MSAWAERCDRTYWHVSHEWGIEHGDMGVAWRSCPGLHSWDTDDRGEALVNKPTESPQEEP